MQTEGESILHTKGKSILQTKIILFFLLILLLHLIFGITASALAWNAELTSEESRMPEARYYNPTFADFPPEITNALLQGTIDREDVLDFENAADLQKRGYQNVENGYRLLDDGSGYVAVKTDFPGATGDMIYWWFWWHGYKDIRYKIWCPDYHYGVKIKDLSRANNPFLSYKKRVENNTIYSTENVGMGIQTLAIKFVPPEKFGFDPSQFKYQGIEAVLCVEVGLMIAGINIEHSYMCHVWRKIPNGLELRSRFWLGKKLQCTWLRELIFTEDTLRDMLMHCSLEYNHLAGFLPKIYYEFGPRWR